MKYPKLLGILLMLVLVLTACSSAGTPTNAPVNTRPAATIRPSGTGTAGIPSTGGTGTPSTGGLHTGTPSTSGGTSTSGTPAAGGTKVSGTPSTGSTSVSGTPSASGTGTAGVPNTGAACATVTVQLNTAVKTTGTSTSGTATTGTSTPSTGGTTSTMTPAAGSGTSTSGTATSGGASSSSNAYLVDCNGNALYIDMDDTPNSGSSSCTDATCTTNWKPLTMESGKTPMAGQGVDKSLLSTITRDDGTMQVTYNGWPLYLYSGDKTPGATNGIGLQGKWFLMGADGNPIQTTTK